jgi:hypothetical protein
MTIESMDGSILHHVVAAGYQRREAAQQAFVVVLAGLCVANSPISTGKGMPGSCFHF